MTLGLQKGKGGTKLIILWGYSPPSRIILKLRDRNDARSALGGDCDQSLYPSLGTRLQLRHELKVKLPYSLILRSSLDFNETKAANPKGNQPWIFTGRTMDEAPILCHPDVKSWLTGKDPNTGKDWRQKKKGQPRMRWLDSITDSMDMNLSTLQEVVETEWPGVLQSMRLQRDGHDLVTGKQQHRNSLIQRNLKGKLHWCWAEDKSLRNRNRNWVLWSDSHKSTF